MKLKFPMQLLSFAICWLVGIACFAGESSVLVTSKAMKKQRLAAAITSYGVVAMDPRNTETISFPRPGLITRLMVTTGQLVHSGTTLLEFTADPTNTQSFAQASSAVDFAQGELKRTGNMVAQQMATQSQLASARKALADAEAALKAQRELGMERSSERIKSTFAGIVTSLNVKQGDRIQAGLALMNISPRSAMRIELGVEPEDSSRIKVGMPVRIVSVFDSSKTLTGAVAEIHGVIDPQTRLVEVIVRVKGKQTEKLVLGTRVRGEIVLSSVTSWTVPHSTVLHDTKGSYIFQIDHDHARRINVKAGVEDHGVIGIRGNFDSALKVVVVGNYELADGMAVRESSP